MPKMKHPDSKSAIDVAPAQVAMYESQGWRKTAPKKTSAQASNTTPATDATTKE